MHSYRSHRRFVDERGVALLLTLLMLSLLVVLVGQFSYSVVLDRKVATNHLRDAQGSLDVFAGACAAARQISSTDAGGKQGAAGSELQINSAGSQISVRLEKEDAKLNVNALLEPPEGVSPERAQQVLDRLFRSLAETGEAVPEGLAASIAQYLRDRGGPALTLLELENVEGVTRELLYGGAQDAAEPGVEASGLSRYLTVWSDGRIDYNCADEKVLASLVPGLNPQMLDALLKALENPSGNYPPDIRRAAEDVGAFVKPDSSTYSALVVSRSEEYEKKCLVVLARGENGVSAIRWDELEP